MAQMAQTELIPKEKETFFMMKEMGDSQKTIFRKTSLDRVNSPDQLDDYMRVTSPSVWLVLVAVILLLVGACIWGAFGHMDTVLTMGAQVEDGVITCYVDSSDVGDISTGMTVTINDDEFEVTDVATIPVQTDHLDETVCELGALPQDSKAYAVELSGTLPDGVYEAQTVTGSIAPMSFLINNQSN